MKNFSKYYFLYNNNCRVKKNLITLLICMHILMLISGCSKEKVIPENSFDGQARNLIEKVIKVQYNNEKIDLNSVFSDEFIRLIPALSNFYKIGFKRYKIISDNVTEIKDKNADTISVSVRILDIKGEYIQVMELIKLNGKYLVNKIEYDI